MNERERALAILQRIRREEAYATPLLEREGGDDRDRRFIRNLVLGVLRWRGEIDFLIEQLAQRRINKLDPATVDILRLGIYQVLHTDVPAHAVVNESVRLAQKRASRSKGLVNAVMRRASAGDLRALLPPGDDLDALAVTSSHPKWLLERWVATFGAERAKAIACANQEHSQPDLFVNEEKTDADAALESLLAKGVAVERSPFLPNVLRLRGSVTAVAEELERGALYAMDEGSVLVAMLVSGRGRRVLDMAAAPGGKSVVLAARGHEVTAHDLSLARLQSLRSGFPRMFGRAARIVVGDGLLPAFRQRFDSVLLDAPCSATGTIRKNPELKWRLDAATVGEISKLQEVLLERALDLTAEECIYATCSLEPEENDEVVARVVARRGEFELAPLDEVVPPSVVHFVEKGILRLTPDCGTDGFTAHRIIRR